MGKGGAVNLTVNAGVNVMGSRNVMISSGGDGCASRLSSGGQEAESESGSEDPTTRVGRKRRAGDAGVDGGDGGGKKVKVEEGGEEGVEA